MKTYKIGVRSDVGPSRWKMVEVQGTEVRLVPWMYTFVHREYSTKKPPKECGWVVTEFISGFAVRMGKTKKEAIAKSLAILKKKGRATCLEAVRKGLTEICS